jgi:hypothetical protein
MTTFLGHEPSFWMELLQKSVTEGTVDLMEEIAHLRSKVSFYEKRISEMGSFMLRSLDTNNLTGEIANIELNKTTPGTKKALIDKIWKNLNESLDKADANANPLTTLAVHKYDIEKAVNKI